MLIFHIRVKIVKSIGIDSAIGMLQKEHKLNVNFKRSRVIAITKYGKISHIKHPSYCKCRLQQANDFLTFQPFSSD